MYVRALTSTADKTSVGSTHVDGRISDISIAASETSLNDSIRIVVTTIVIIKGLEDGEKLFARVVTRAH